MSTQHQCATDLKTFSIRSMQLLHNPEKEHINFYKLATMPDMQKMMAEHMMVPAHARAHSPAAMHSNREQRAVGTCLQLLQCMLRVLDLAVLASQRLLLLGAAAQQGQRTLLRVAQLPLQPGELPL